MFEVGKGEPPATQVTPGGRKLCLSGTRGCSCHLSGDLLGEGSTCVKAAMCMGMRTQSTRKPRVREAERETSGKLVLRSLLTQAFVGLGTLHF